MQRIGSLGLQWDSWCKVCWVLIDSSSFAWRCMATHSDQSFGMNTCGKGQDLDHTGSHCYFAISHRRTQEQGVSRQTFDEKGISFALGQFVLSPPGVNGSLGYRAPKKQRQPDGAVSEAPRTTTGIKKTQPSFPVTLDSETQTRGKVWVGSGQDGPETAKENQRPNPS